MPETTLTELFGTAIPAGSELESVRGVPGVPWHLYGGPSLTPSGAISARTTEAAFLNVNDRYRIPYDGEVIGMRIPAFTTDLDLSASLIDIFQVLYCDGSTADSAKTIRGRSENIDKSRLVADGDYFYLLFQNPITVQRGDQPALRLRVSGDPAVAISPNYHIAVDDRGSGTSLVTDGTDVVTDAATDFTNLVYPIVGNRPIFIYSGGNSANHGYYIVDQVAPGADNTKLDLLTTPPQAASNHRWVATLIAPQSGYLWETGDISGNGPFNFATFIAGLGDVSNLDITPIMRKAPSIAIVGTSVESGSVPSTSATGSTFDWSSDHDWDLNNNLGKHLQDLGFDGCMVMASAGRKVDQWNNNNGGGPWAIFNSGEAYEGTNFAQARATWVIYNTIVNDCLDSWTESTYTAALDTLKALVESAGSRLIMTTGTPIPGRSGSAVTAASTIRGWVRGWCDINGVPMIDTEMRLRETGEDTLPAVFDSGDGIHLNNTGTTAYGQAIASGLQEITWSSTPVSQGLHSINTGI